MKALYIYNPNSEPELALIEKAQKEMSSYITTVSVDDCPQMLRNLVRATPALIIVSDDLQGEGLIAEGVDGKLLVAAMLYKRLEEEDLAIHNVETHRLDNMISAEVQKKIDTIAEKVIL